MIKTLILALAALMSTSLSSATPSDNFDPINPSASGYHVIFSDDFSSATTLDSGDTLKASFKWFVRPFLGGHQQPGSVIKIADGHLTVAGGGGVGTAAPLDNRGHVVGHTFGGGGYFEATVSLGYKPTDSKGWPAFWGMAVEHLNGDHGDADPIGPRGAVRYAEDDFFERDTGFAGNDAYGATVHEFFGRYQVSCIGHSYCSHSSDGTSPFHNFVVRLPPHVDWSAKHTISQLWLLASAKSPGSLKNYFDGRLVSSVTWSSSPAAFMSEMDREHLVIFLNSGTQPMHVYSVKVWQR